MKVKSGYNLADGFSLINFHRKRADTETWNIPKVS
jgi:hypothetical protein